MALKVIAAGCGVGLVWIVILIVCDVRRHRRLARMKLAAQLPAKAGTETQRTGAVDARGNRDGGSGVSDAGELTDGQVGNLLRIGTEEREP